MRAGPFINFTCTLGFFLSACSPKQDLQQGPSPVKTPEEELTSFKLEPGFKIQLVASEPMVQDPVFLTYDADGRLWVVEMRGFMPDIDGQGEQAPVGRVSVLEDLDGDGVMDSSHIFLDSLIMPRALALVQDGILIAENKSLWLAQDQDKNLKADHKQLIDSTYAHSDLPEHTDNGLWRGMDNWYYSAKSRLRYKWSGNKWLRDSTEFRGQWGLCHDDEGRLYYNYNWSQLHADLVPPNYLSRNQNHTPTSGIDHGLTIDRRIYPIRPNPAVNRGYIPGTLDSSGKLLEFTAACAPLMVRSDQYPRALQHNVFVCEPSGNLIKRNVVEENGFTLTAYDPHPGYEFLASTDERFRPVNLCASPDGSILVADMYRGLIQHGAYVTPYLREQTISRKLVAPINRGRIWRITPDEMKPVPVRKLSTMTIDSLVQILNHPNGWQRDMAQRLLVERGDQSALKPLLELISRREYKSISRNQALWTLEGLGWNDTDVLLKLVEDSSVLIRNTALRLLEQPVQKDKLLQAKLASELLSDIGSAPVDQQLQIALSAFIFEPAQRYPLLAGILKQSGTYTLIRDAVLSSLQNLEYGFMQYLLSLPEWTETAPEKEIFIEMLTACIVRHGVATEILPLLVKLDKSAKQYAWSDRVLITSLEIQSKNSKNKPIVLKSTPLLFKRTEWIEMDKNKIQSIKRLFQWPGYVREPNDVAQFNLSEDQQPLFVKGRQHYLTTCAGCHGMDGAGINRFAPPLIGSDWVLGDERRLALIVLHGMEGAVEIGGKVYDAPEILPVMPAHSTMDDASITAVLTYIRNEWGNKGGPLSRGLVGKTRHTTQGRVMPWTAKELDKFIAETKPSANNQ